MNIDEFLARFISAHPAGKHQWMALCPAHAEKHPSLSIGLSQDGRILLHCFAGCSTTAVLETLGLHWSALFPDSHTHHSNTALSWSEKKSLDSTICALACQDWLNGMIPSEHDSHRIGESAKWILRGELLVYLPIRLLLRRFTDVRAKGLQIWTARCPNHPEEDAQSIGIRIQPDRSIRIDCFAGCSNEALLPHLQLSWCEIVPTEYPRGETGTQQQAARLCACACRAWRLGEQPPPKDRHRIQEAIRILLRIGGSHDGTTSLWPMV